MVQSPKTLLPLVARYQKPATRLAALQLQNKEAAHDIVTIIFEELYDQQLFHEGPHLRPLLIQRIKWSCTLVNRLTSPSIYHNTIPLSKYQNHSAK